MFTFSIKHVWIGLLSNCISKRYLIFISIETEKELGSKYHYLCFTSNIFYRWKVLDFAELKRSSISFFDIEKPESVQSRWSRARTRAAKVLYMHT